MGSPTRWRLEAQRRAEHNAEVDEVAWMLLALVTRLHDHHTGKNPLYPPVRPNEARRQVIASAPTNGGSR